MQNELTVREVIRELSEYDMEDKVYVNLIGKVADTQEFPPSKREREYEVEIELDKTVKANEIDEVYLKSEYCNRKRAYPCINVYL